MSSDKIKREYRIYRDGVLVQEDLYHSYEVIDWLQENRGMCYNGKKKPTPCKGFTITKDGVDCTPREDFDDTVKFVVVG